MVLLGYAAKRNLSRINKLSLSEALQYMNTVGYFIFKGAGKNAEEWRGDYC
jgi:hypothetical protein